MNKTFRHIANILKALALTLTLSATAVSPAQAAWAVVEATGLYPTVAYGASTPFKARSKALKDCARKYKDCRVVDSGAGGCFTYAQADKKHWAFGKGSNRVAAEKSAIAACKAKFGGTCKAARPICDRR